MPNHVTNRIKITDDPDMVKRLNKIKSVSLHDLRKMNDSEGLVLQGCGGDLQEWVNGINDMLTESGILSGGNRFEKAYSFKNGELTCLLFPFDDVQLDVGKLAIWRLRTREDFGSTWLSDYVPNRLGGFISEQDEDFEVIEIAGQTALFSNERLDSADIPKGTYCYDLRQSDDGDRFCSIEKSVTVNHGGSVITKEPIDLGEKGFIPLTDDTEPNFIGKTSTFSDFMSNEDRCYMEETEDFEMEMG